MSVPTDKNAPNETFCDGLHKLCRYLCDTYKDKDIIFLTPIKRKQPKGTSGGTWDCLDPDATNAEGKTLMDYRDAIIEACEYYSIPYIDMYTLSGLDPHTDPSLFADTDGRAVHPNEEGHRIFADALIEQMLKLKR
jgi:lysophospholipase L1-like esterase